MPGIIRGRRRARPWIRAWRPAASVLKRLDADALNQLGLSLENPGQAPDVYVRIPDSPEAVFRAAVERDGVPVSDVLQVWLDVANHPSRGKAQADEGSSLCRQPDGLRPS